jgi:hypothetical protein
MQHTSAAGSEVSGSDDLELTEALEVLRTEHGVQASYHQLWMAVVEGRAPAYRVGKRWKVKRSDVPVIAEVLGGTSAAVAA